MSPVRGCMAAMLPPQPTSSAVTLRLLEAHPHVAHVARASYSWLHSVLRSSPLSRWLKRWAKWRPQLPQGTAGVSGLDTRQIQVLLGRSHMN